ncbi:hypothetical protein Y032_0007g3317 [Ancylostoma ceylanicum]|uniref:Uncharacterized protein n=1 Tax=Ancylostoma ceylanicum TaxID=53326 RepID=A0A016VM00_9BILA|nr:hypothetical protein Y032_0007g3317 [Ancylostoma ceylanicum]
MRPLHALKRRLRWRRYVVCVRARSVHGDQPRIRLSDVFCGACTLEKPTVSWQTAITNEPHLAGNEREQTKRFVVGNDSGFGLLSGQRLLPRGLTSSPASARGERHGNDAMQTVTQGQGREDVPIRNQATAKGRET